MASRLNLVGPLTERLCFSSCLVPVPSPIVRQLFPSLFDSGGGRIKTKDIVEDFDRTNHETRREDEKGDSGTDTINNAWQD